MRTNWPTRCECSTRIDFHAAKVLAIGLLWIFASDTFANTGEEPLGKDFRACMDRSGGVTVDMRACMSAELGRQDARLNNAYQQLRRKLEPAASAKLKAAQRAWIAYRNANCQFAGAQEEGTLGPVVIDDCHLQMTARRAGELEQSLKSL